MMRMEPGMPQLPQRPEQERMPAEEARAILFAEVLAQWEEMIARTAMDTSDHKGADAGDTAAQAARDRTQAKQELLHNLGSSVGWAGIEALPRGIIGRRTGVSTALRRQP